MPADDAADELAGLMFAQLAVRGGTATVLEHGLPRAEVLQRVADLGVEQVFISALAPFAYTQAREVCRDLRNHFPGMRIVVALWDLRAEAERLRRRLAAAGADEVVATLQEAVLAIRLAQANELDPADLTAELRRALYEGETEAAEALLTEAERRLPAETLAVEVLQPALEDLLQDGAAGRLTAEQEDLASDFLRKRILALGEGAPEGRGFRALAACAPEEPHEIGLLVLSVLLRRAGWSVVYLGQRVPGDGLDEVIASVQPHALLLAATHEEDAEPLLRLAERLHALHPELLLVFGGRGFRPAALGGLGNAAVLVPGDPRQAVESIERLMPAQGPPVNQAA